MAEVCGGGLAPALICVGEGKVLSASLVLAVTLAPPPVRLVSFGANVIKFIVDISLHVAVGCNVISIALFELVVRT